MKSKKLSHRLRKFSEIELTESAFRNSLKSDFTYLEIDTRVSKDKEIYIYHNSTTNNTTKKIFFKEELSGDIDNVQYTNKEKIFKLWVFGVDNKKEFDKFNKVSEISAIFCDKII